MVGLELSAPPDVPDRLEHGHTPRAAPDGRIVVRGRVGEHLAAGFRGFELAFEAGETALTGSLRDRAQLHGMLERLGDLGIQLVSINGEEPRR